MRKFVAFDLVVFGYIALISAVVLVFQPPGTAIYLAYHAAMVALIVLVIHADQRYGGAFWRFLRQWYVILIGLAGFRELHYLIPQVHPFDDLRYDRILAELDLRLFGDVDRFFLQAWPPMLADLLHLCYWFHFFGIFIPCGILYARQDMVKLREYTAVVMTALLTSYAAYFLVPAIGPHHFYAVRPAILDGWMLGASMHRAILAAEWRMPDAFPSGHALMSMVVIGMSWRLHRPSFRWVVMPALGCIVATMALRYHYIVDVIASLAIFPIVMLAGSALSRRWDPGVTVSATQKR